MIAKDATLHKKFIQNFDNEKKSLEKKNFIYSRKKDYHKEKVSFTVCILSTKNGSNSFIKIMKNIINKEVFKAC